MVFSVFAIIVICLAYTLSTRGGDRYRKLFPGNFLGRSTLSWQYGFLAVCTMAFMVLVFSLFWYLFKDSLVQHIAEIYYSNDLLNSTNESAHEMYRVYSDGFELSGDMKAVSDAKFDTVMGSVERVESLVDWSGLLIFAILSIFLIFLMTRRFFYRLAPAWALEKTVKILLLFCAAFTIIVTIGIIFSLAFEAFRFFTIVPLHKFIFGIDWNPQSVTSLSWDPENPGSAVEEAFGVLPVFSGTFMITLIAMLVAFPVGLLSAIYLRIYASNRVSSVVKPVVELLAGIPTLVYGFFAVLVVMPGVKAFFSFFGIEVAPNNALTAGLVMGIMIIPFILSLADNAIAAVPSSLNSGALALGATTSEALFDVVLPAASHGIFSGFLLAVSRAVGETMIVVMAAGLIAKLTIDPLDSVTTASVQIVSLLTGDVEFDNPKTLAAFAIGIVLFTITFFLNVFSYALSKKWKVII